MNNLKVVNLKSDDSFLKRKSVSFSDDVKLHDGTSYKNIIYSKIIINFFKKKIKNGKDILKITKDKDILYFCLNECRIAKSKLEHIYKINNIFFRILNYTIQDNIKSSGFSIIRSGSRDINFRFLPSHLKNINRLIKLFDFILNIYN